MLVVAADVLMEGFISTMFYSSRVADPYWPTTLPRAKLSLLSWKVIVREDVWKVTPVLFCKLAMKPKDLHEVFDGIVCTVVIVKVWITLFAVAVPDCQSPITEAGLVVADWVRVIFYIFITFPPFIE